MKKSEIINFLASTILVFILFIIPTSLSSQTYCNPINTNNSRSAAYYISKFSLGEIDNISDLSANPYEFYTNKTAEVIRGQAYAASVTFNIPNYNTGTINIWIDYNKNGTFEASEIVTTYTETLPASSTGITKPFQITIPTNATIGLTRIRVGLSRGNSIDACNLSYQAGEYEDYLINIKPIPQPPTAICVENLGINLDILGNATITADDINNGSYDDTDNANDLILSIDKSTFNCDDIGTPQTVTLTVTDLDGLSSTCTTTVTVSPYSGAFVAPTLNDVTKYCSYTASTPIMDYQCNQQIVATTTDQTSFNTAGVYTINWVFDNGSNTETSTQTITIKNPTIPTNLLATNISEKRADISWDSSDNGPYKIRYRLNGTNNPWIETTSTTKSKTLNNLDDGVTYEVQVKVDANCAAYSASKTFSTFAIIYCNTNLNLSKGNYWISNVTIGNINNTTPKSDPFYNYFDTAGTSLEAGKTFSGTITYSRQSYNDTYLVVWIDFNGNGDFSPDEEVYSIENIGSATTSFTITLNNILIPLTAKPGKTRLRVGLSHNEKPSPCNFNSQSGEVEDYNIQITPQDNSSFESALFTQTYHTSSTERWIEVSNINSTKSIPSNTVILALYKNKTGDQTGVIPTSTFTINTPIAPGSSILIKNSSSIFSNTSGTVISNNSITDFDGENDVLIVTNKTGNDAWKNRFDVLSNIKNNTSMVRIDAANTHNKNFNPNQWVYFVDDKLSTTTSPPERHPHAPLLSEILTANTNANIRLGIHKINAVTRENESWQNGFPDRSRKVEINQNYISSSKLNARELHITGNNILTINNNLLTVSNLLSINSNASIRLAGTSQLIQTHTGSKQISGNGKIYIDKTSLLTNVYQSGNWSSPVTSNGGAFTIKNVMKDGTIPTSSTSNPPDINFTDIHTLDGKKTSPITISSRWLAKLVNDVDYKRLISPTSEFFNPGEAWNMKSTGNGTQNFTFKGVPNDGEYTSSISQGKLSLIGNPYPSAIDADLFLKENSTAISGTLYFYESGEENSHIRATYQGGYATRVIGMGTPFGKGKTPSKYIPVSQAFFVSRGTAGNATIKFTNALRVYNTSNNFFNKNNVNIDEETSDFPILRLGFEFAINEAEIFERKVAIGFRGLSTTFKDGYDAYMFDRKPTDMGLKVDDVDSPFVITGVQDFNKDIEIPLHVYLDINRTVTFKVDTFENLNTPVYLRDKFKDEQYELSKEGVSLELSAGEYSDRFTIEFKKSTTLSVTDDLLNEKIIAYIDTSSKALIIKNPKNIMLKAVELHSILGQKVFSSNIMNNTSENKFPLSSHIKSGIYFIKIHSEKGGFVRKVFIGN